MNIINYDDLKHRSQVIELWKTALNYTQPRNNPGKAIDRKLAQKDDLFFVADQEGKILGTIMVGYDGHRGWIYSLAVDQQHRNIGIGRLLTQHAINILTALGCPKINLQILPDNTAVKSFYEKLGFREEKRVSMGMEIVENNKDL